MKKKQEGENKNMKITKILSKPYRQFFRYNIDVEVTDNGLIKQGQLPSKSLEHIKNRKVGDNVYCVV